MCENHERERDHGTRTIKLICVQVETLSPSRLCGLGLEGEEDSITTIHFDLVNMKP